MSRWEVRQSRSDHREYLPLLGAVDHLVLEHLSRFRRGPQCQMAHKIPEGNTRMRRQLVELPLKTLEELRLEGEFGAADGCAQGNQSHRRQVGAG